MRQRSAFDQLEEILITSDVGLPTTIKIIDRFEERVARDKYVNTKQLNAILVDEIATILSENKTEDLADFRETLRRLPDIPASIWITSHHRGVYTEREHFLQDLSEFSSKIDLREQLLLERLGEQPRDLE